MAQPNHTPRLAHTEVALTVIFCVVDDAYTLLNPRARRYESLNRLAGLGDHRACTLPAAEGCGERTLVLAGRREVLLSAVPWGSGAAPFLVPSAGEEAEALSGASAPRGPLRDGRRPADAARRLDAAFGFAPQAGF